MNNKHKYLSWFKILLGGNSLTSNRLILMETGVTKGDYSAGLVHV
jgi:hypothetical protein